ncbi:hypothetical protein [Clostridium estertheticum]|uniref:hypothetical protein n=1 Tax=Clostridium estertheticum TaxID=238834 RepID=UPI001A9A5991|nr:hypothetical protein [Clostridium estertheticum]MBZ9613940.1 hypothetical protein [Clostridium estertheticum subsp. laramiense]WAG73901.1 hypothetical protein LL032_00095 [Clostridium estertheticum]
MERTIVKAGLTQRFKDYLQLVDKHDFIGSYRIIVELLEQAVAEIMLHKILQGLVHYLNVLRGDITIEEG